jgi:hypothetical protein
MKDWTKWKPMPAPENCKTIEGPDGPGVYQIRNKVTNQLVQFGIGINCQKRMKSLFPAPYGSGTRNNANKREYILKFWKSLEYRTLETESREAAKLVEDRLKAERNHLFNT